MIVALKDKLVEVVVSFEYLGSKITIDGWIKTGEVLYQWWEKNFERNEDYSVVEQFEWM